MAWCGPESCSRRVDESVHGQHNRAVLVVQRCERHLGTVSRTFAGITRILRGRLSLSLSLSLRFGCLYPVSRVVEVVRLHDDDRRNIALFGTGGAGARPGVGQKSCPRRVD
jgi:hypothetical protein